LGVRFFFDNLKVLLYRHDLLSASAFDETCHQSTHFPQQGSSQYSFQQIADEIVKQETNAQIAKVEAQIEIVKAEAKEEVAAAERRVAEKFLMYGNAAEYARYQELVRIKKEEKEK
jgi:hypothetical protein